MVGNAMVQTKMGTSWFKLKQEESATHEQETIPMSWQAMENNYNIDNK